MVLTELVGEQTNHDATYVFPTRHHDRYQTFVPLYTQYAHEDIQVMSTVYCLQK